MDNMSNINAEENARNLINELKVVDWDVRNDEVLFILVENTGRNIGVLETIAHIFQSNYNVYNYINEELIDISSLGFEFGNYWSEAEGFREV